jgi:hypothetical protein
MKTWSTAPTNDFDAPNPGTIMIGFEIKVRAKEEIAHSVLLFSGGNEKFVEDKVNALTDW